MRVLCRRVCTPQGDSVDSMDKINARDKLKSREKFLVPYGFKPSSPPKKLYAQRLRVMVTNWLGARVQRWQAWPYPRGTSWLMCVLSVLISVSCVGAFPWGAEPDLARTTACSLAASRLGRQRVCLVRRCRLTQSQRYGDSWGWRSLWPMGLYQCVRCVVVGYVVQPKNFRGGSTKKGSYGFVGTTIAPLPEYVADPYDDHRLAQQVRLSW